MHKRSTGELADLSARPPQERADAARNRNRILTAAAQLFAEHGVDGVSLDAIAARAQVGKGTLFRRFGDKAGLAAALLDGEDRDLQERILFGPPPLGPGAAPAARITAFFDAYLDLLEVNLELVRLSETAAPGARYRVGSYRFWQHHLAILLTEARPELDADCVAHLLLAPLDADLQHSLRERGFADGRTRAAVGGLVRQVLGG
ncbi:TetR/AcrR family transcriptional regulator [Streptomyces sp. NPDC059008]|uniref:TetR/AcrR family transcriptional regulator n=1 Tax=unclassified Streptomyces TaxID=2593676 RepID=UPI0036A5E3F6